MIFYAVPVSNFCAKVEIVLDLKKLSYEKMLPPGGYGSSDYKAIVPLGTVPALVDGDLVLSESESINEYLNEKEPHCPLLPHNIADRAKVRLISRLHDLKVEPTIRSLFKHMAPSQRDEIFVTSQRHTLEAQLYLIEEMAGIGPYISGQDLSLADCGYAPSLLLADRMFNTLGQDFEKPPAFQKWQQTVADHSVIGPVLANYKIVVDQWIESKSEL